MIATANANGVEPIAYLTECLRHHEDLAKRPEHYLPWVYRDRLEALDGDQVAAAVDDRRYAGSAVCMTGCQGGVQKLIGHGQGDIRTLGNLWSLGPHGT